MTCDRGLHEKTATKKTKIKTIKKYQKCTIKSLKIVGWCKHIIIVCDSIKQSLT